jgi:hypothetical protein
MYFPLVQRHRPSSVQRRIASIESAAGFACYSGLLFALASGRPVFLVGAGLAIFICLHGLWTLSRTHTNPATLAEPDGWVARLRHHLGWSGSADVLDERDLGIRYRTFVTCYQILCVLCVAALGIGIFTGFFPWLVAESTRLLWTRLNLFCLRVMSIAIFLLVLLPQWVRPWHEPAGDIDDEPVHSVGSLRVKPKQKLLPNLLYWLVAACILGAWLWTVTRLSSPIEHPR